MGSVREAAITGFNEYINELKNSGFHYYVTLVLFNDELEQRFTKLPIAQVPALTQLTYLPNGGTALYDAVCNTLGSPIESSNVPLSTKILRRFEKHVPNVLSRPVDVGQQNIVVILTDGEDNCSRRWRSADFRSLVETREATGRWKFVFLGANQDAWANAQQWGFAEASVASFNNTTRGLGNAMLRTAEATNCFMAQVSSGAAPKSFFSKEDQENLKDVK